jgi:molecular chaperone DnaK
LSEAGDKVPASEKAPVEAAIQALKEVVGGDNVDEIKSKTETLAQVAMKLGESMYKAQQEAGGPQGPDGGPQAGPGGQHQGHDDDKVVDADFEEVDEKKRRSG